MIEYWLVCNGQCINSPTPPTCITGENKNCGYCMAGLTLNAINNQCMCPSANYFVNLQLGVCQGKFHHFYIIFKSSMWLYL